MTSRFIRPLRVALAFFGMLTGNSQVPPANYDEAKVGNHPLPDPLKFEGGGPVRDALEWREKRRPELLELFRTHVYGRSPGKPATILFEKTAEDARALGGKATRREVAIYLRADKTGPRLNLLLYIPNSQANGASGAGPAPAFLGLNFEGNHTVDLDPGITLGTVWVKKDRSNELVAKAAEESTRGSQASRWQVEKVIRAGYALATMYYGDIDPDFHDGFQNGIHPLSDRFGAGPRPGDAWGSIAGWAWGLSRALDYLETDAAINAGKVALLGHSRLGKTALWAGAEDERFAIVISNNSGCGGAALNRRDFGESVARINTSFPHWFCGNFKQYNNNEAACPVDQHQLIALIAPRPVYVASASEDLWADPKGEFLGAKGAEPVYKLLGLDGLPAEEMPGADQPVMGSIGYHLRTGKHDVTAFDWDQFIRFANRHFRRGAP